MDDAERHLTTGEIERSLLAALCGSLDHKIRTEILKRLAAHAFASPDHEVIFRALVKMPRTGEHIRETLCARITRLGFPDIDLEPILKLEPPSAGKIKALLQQLSR